MRIVYQAFDLLFLDGHDLRDLPLIAVKGLEKSGQVSHDRASAVATPLHRARTGPWPRYSVLPVAGSGSVVSKRLDARYQPGAVRSGEGDMPLVRRFVIGGFTPPRVEDRLVPGVG